MSKPTYCPQNSVDQIKGSQVFEVEACQHIPTADSDTRPIDLTPNAMNTKPKSNIAEFQCRICLEKEADSKILVNLCLCKGSLKYIHNECLNQWIQQQVSTKENLKKILSDGLVCEICKSSTKVSVAFSTRCRSSEQIEEVMVKNKLIKQICYFIMLVCLIAEIVGIIALGLELASGGIKIFLFVATAVCGAISPIIATYFVKKFFFIKVISYIPTHDRL